jgi:hypothetical protein
LRGSVWSYGPHGVLRRSWSPWWRQAYYGEAEADALGIKEPQVYWIDNSHLTIDYPTRGGLRADCAAKLGDIVVTCHSH